jgi:glutamine amidotransferase PdxT
MAREDSVLVASFHPELTDDPTVHRYFVDMVASSGA